MRRLRYDTLRRIRYELRNRPAPQARHMDINGHDVVQITFMKEQAEKVLEPAIRQAKLKKPVFGPNEFDEIVRTTHCGFLGQVAFYLWAYDEFETGLSSITVGRSDEQDFKLIGYTGDVKCACKRNADLMLMPEYRFQKKKFDLYVGSRLMQKDPYIVQIWGYATRQELESKGETIDLGWGPSRAYPLNKLHPAIGLKNLDPA